MIGLLDIRNMLAEEQKSSDRPITIMLTKSHDLGCAFLFVLGLWLIILVTQLSSITTTGSLNYQLLTYHVFFVVMSLPLVVMFFLPRKLRIDQTTATMPFRSFVLANISKIEQVSYLSNPFTLVIHLVSGHALLVELGTESSLNDLLAALKQRGVELSEQIVQPGTTAVLAGMGSSIWLVTISRTWVQSGSENSITQNKAEILGNSAFPLQTIKTLQPRAAQTLKAGLLFGYCILPIILLIAFLIYLVIYGHV